MIVMHNVEMETIEIKYVEHEGNELLDFLRAYTEDEEVQGNTKIVKYEVPSSWIEKVIKPFIESYNEMASINESSAKIILDLP
ncbi:gp635 [Bacillus phage G]|uniref:Gp635 n=1 Tax=Bacillus phage G TaxID=2884420 RepID=G3MB15_9CAUD|nr:gp635 [Bacillus phage G]AEO93879.1 gp635 [Bacillus phage G]